MNPVNEPHTVTVDEVSHLVQNMCVSLSMFSLYSAEHPVVRQPLEKCFVTLDELLRTREDFHIYISDGVVLFEGLSLEDRNPVIKKFVHIVSHHGVKCISFHRGVEMNEIALFFKIITTTTQATSTHEDIRKALTAANITHIGVNDSEYRLINSNEKVVGIDAITTEHTHDKDTQRRAILETLIDEILERDEDILTLLMDVRNNPTSVADHIITALEGYERGEVDRDTIITKLIKNIERVGMNLDKMEDSGMVSAEEMAKSLASLEVELKMKGRSLHTKEAQSFINKVTDLVASYADTSRAVQVVNEFVKHEKSLAEAEKMMNEVAPEATVSARLLMRIEQLMEERGVDDEELVNLVERQIEKQSIKKEKKITKKFQPLSKKITQQFEKTFHNVAPEDEKEFVGYLDRTLKEEVKKEVAKITKEMEEKVAYQRQCRLRIADVFSGIRVGVAVIDDRNVIVQVINGGFLPELIEGDKLSQELTDVLHSFRGQPVLYKATTKIAKVVMDDTQKIISFMFLPL